VACTAQAGDAIIGSPKLLWGGATRGADSGLLGLPLVRPGPAQTRPAADRPAGSASMLFLRHESLRFTPLGELAARAGGGADACRASCVDWYGKARPLFVDRRVFALLGYELVEGRLEGAAGDAGERLAERRRIDFTPRVPARGGRSSPFD